MLKNMNHPYQKQTYKIDLVHQHRLCETNYIRLMHLLPNLFEQDSHRLIIDFGSHQHRQEEVLVIFDVIQRSPYTTLIQLRFSAHWGGWLVMPAFNIRLYHDVNMAEVVFNKHSERLQSKYQYPNPEMNQPDEKKQWNQLLAECLEYCRQGGISPQPVFFNDTI